MRKELSQHSRKSLLDDPTTFRKLEINKKRNEAQDQTENIDQAAKAFQYEQCKNSYWNPESFSLLYGTPIWEQASPSQKIILNQLYWVAYYSQIISAEIATIYLNQVAAAGLYSIEDFRIVGDSLDLESKQERAHVNAFKTISEEVEWQLFGERMFTYPMKGPFEETMIFADSNYAKRFWRKLNLHAFSALSTHNAFLASQYLLVRGLRTLNGKLIQHELSNYYINHPNKESAPIPSAISYYHFLDESHHFNTSKIVGCDIPRSLEPPSSFETFVINKGVVGCQRDHFNFSIAIKGIFWYDPSLIPVIYRIFRSKVFAMSDGDATEMLYLSFGRETQGLHDSFATHRLAVESYKAFVEPLSYLSKSNLEMQLMSKNSMEHYLNQTQKYLKKSFPFKKTSIRKPSFA